MKQSQSPDFQEGRSHLWAFTSLCTVRWWYGRSLRALEAWICIASMTITQFYPSKDRESIRMLPPEDQSKSRGETAAAWGAGKLQRCVCVRAGKHVMTLKMPEIKFLTHLWGVISFPYHQSLGQNSIQGLRLLYGTSKNQVYLQSFLLVLPQQLSAKSLCYVVPGRCASYLPSRTATNADQHKIINFFETPWDVIFAIL